MLRFSIKVLVFFLLMSSLIYAQKQATHWYLGDSIGLHFVNNVATPFIATDPNRTFVNEGGASISDSNGDLLFYTNNVFIWNRNHEVMVNGDSLWGNYSSTQGALIIPQPGNDSIYYVFIAGTRTDFSPLSHSIPYNNGLTYSVVNMNKQGGLGEVVIKNNILIINNSEKITAVETCDKNGVWIVTHTDIGDTFYTYKLTSTGLEAPIKTNIGYVYNYDNTVLPNIGQMMFSPNGKYLAIVHKQFIGIEALELYKFDRSTGIMSDLITIDTVQDPYGTCFSPNSSKVYCTNYDFSSGTSRILQFNLSVWDVDSIIASKAEASVGVSEGGLTLGIDGRLYQMSGQFGSTMIVLENPNDNTNDINVEFLSLIRSTGLGAPNFIQSYFQDTLKADFDANEVCFGDTTLFTNLSLHNYPDDDVTWSWNFGDPVSGNENNSVLKNPSHLFSNDGDFSVQLIINQPCLEPDTIVKLVTVKSAPYENIFEDTIYIEEGDSAYLNAENFGSSIFWSTGSNDTAIFVSEEGQYNLLILHSSLCRFKDSVYVKILDSIIEEELYIPNVFSPNGDGQNDYLKLFGGPFDQFLFRVYDNKGKMLFETNDHNIYWDGSFNGQNVPAAVYTYYLDATTLSGERLQKRGNISLLE